MQADPSVPEGPQWETQTGLPQRNPEEFPGKWTQSSRRILELSISIPRCSELRAGWKAVRGPGSILGLFQVPSHQLLVKGLRDSSRSKSQEPNFKGITLNCSKRWKVTKKLVVSWFDFKSSLVKWLVERMVRFSYLRLQWEQVWRPCGSPCVGVCQ